MFRRKGEDSLFDTATDQNTSDMTSNESAAPSAPASSMPQPTSPMSAGSPVQANSPLGQGNSPLSRPVSEPRPDIRPEARNTVPQSAGAFRPTNSPLNSPMGGEMSRNRMPEAKPASVASSSSSMSMSGLEKTNTKTGRRVLTVGNDILLKGEIATCDRLVIEGKVDATLNEVHTVEISETGSFKGSANIEDAEISGLFEGDLVVRNRLVIYATGKVRGKISYGEIEIERGGELTGEIKTTNPQAAASARPARSAKEDKMVAA
jgi:cytoskeletal protein CcmA (bactofilin family)